ncbi:MAG: alpha/beta hydrolase [Bacilli bacterium]|nr:alpha/beta hydrolase [Bacilli bacterium]
MTYSYNDISMYYEKYGEQSKSIIILPGWGDTRPTFDTLIQSLSLISTVYILDYPGFGKTEFPEHSMTIYDYADMIHNWIEALEIKDPVFIGHSFGGRLSILLSGYYHYPYSNFILIDSAGIRPKKTLKSWIHSKWYQLQKKLGIFLPASKREKYLKKLFQKYASPDYQALPPNMRKTFQNVVNTDLSYYLKEMQARVLLIWGEKDPSTPLSDAKKMEKEIPNSELVVLKNLGHFPYLENPDWIYRIIVAHLEEIQFIEKINNSYKGTKTNTTPY